MFCMNNWIFSCRPHIPRNILEILFTKVLKTRAQKGERNNFFHSHLNQSQSFLNKLKPTVLEPFFHFFLAIAVMSPVAVWRRRNGCCWKPWWQKGVSFGGVQDQSVLLRKSCLMYLRFYSLSLNLYVFIFKGGHFCNATVDWGQCLTKF